VVLELLDSFDFHFVIDAATKTSHNLAGKRPFDAFNLRTLLHAFLQNHRCGWLYNLGGGCS
jgi:hypothetical protein